MAATISMLPTAMTTSAMTLPSLTDLTVAGKLISGAEHGVLR